YVRVYIGIIVGGGDRLPESHQTIDGDGVSRAGYGDDGRRQSQLQRLQRGTVKFARPARRPCLSSPYLRDHDLPPFRKRPLAVESENAIPARTLSAAGPPRPVRT